MLGRASWTFVAELALEADISRVNGAFSARIFMTSI
jgi:hypothetical protein